MKKAIVLFFSFLSIAVWAGNLPDHMYFQAMNDEMQRTQKELRIKGSSVPFFTVYKLTDVFRHQVSSSLGRLCRKKNRIIICLRRCICTRVMLKRTAPLLCLILNLKIKRQNLRRKTAITLHKVTKDSDGNFGN